MSFNKAPSNWIPNWASNVTDITIPIASLPELTAAEADVTTGDIRKIVFAVMEQLYGKYNSTDNADKPAMMVLSKSASVNTSTGITTNTYSVTIKTSTTAQEVVDEA